MVTEKFRVSPLKVTLVSLLLFSTFCAIPDRLSANEGNLKIIKARYKAVNAHDIRKFEGFYADSIVWVDPGLNQPVKGPVAVGNRLRTFLRVYPDLRWNLDHLFTQGEWVSAEFTFTGTQKG